MILIANLDQSETEISDAESNNLKLEEKHCNADKRSLFTSDFTLTQLVDKIWMQLK